MHRGARYLVLAVVFLLIGAVLTVAVASGCLLWSPPEDPRPRAKSTVAVGAVGATDARTTWVVWHRTTRDARNAA